MAHVFLATTVYSYHHEHRASHEKSDTQDEHADTNARHHSYTGDGAWVAFLQARAERAHRKRAHRNGSTATNGTFVWTVDKKDEDTSVWTGSVGGETWAKVSVVRVETQDLGKAQKRYAACFESDDLVHVSWFETTADYKNRVDRVAGLSFDELALPRVFGANTEGSTAWVRQQQKLAEQKLGRAVSWSQKSYADGAYRVWTASANGVVLGKLSAARLWN